MIYHPETFLRPLHHHHKQPELLTQPIGPVWLNVCALSSQIPVFGWQDWNTMWTSAVLSPSASRFNMLCILRCLSRVVIFITSDLLSTWICLAILLWPLICRIGKLQDGFLFCFVFWAGGGGAILCKPRNCCVWKSLGTSNHRSMAKITGPLIPAKGNLKRYGIQRHARRLSASDFVAL